MGHPLYRKCSNCGAKARNPCADPETGLPYSDLCEARKKGYKEAWAKELAASDHFRTW